MPRRAVELRGLLRPRYKSASQVIVTSISTHGCAAQPGSGFSIGAEVWVRLPGVESWSGEVRWVEDHRIGISFTRPLHPSVVDRLWLSSPKLSCAPAV